jgi:cysteinyl-tRNA synthetase
MDFAELKKKTVVQLKEMAGEYDDITGVSGMKKDQLLDALAEKLGIEKEAAPTTTEKPKKKKKKSRGKGAIKKMIKDLKAQRDKAVEQKDGAALRKVRRQLHRQKVLLRRTVAAS